METKPTLDELLAVLDYDPDTGDILKRDGKRQRDQWVIAGSLHPHGYRFIQVNSGRFGAHRIAWVFLTGRWAPDDKVVDHINGDRGDNRACNLRLATRSHNQANSRRRACNSSGYKGVVKRPGGWEARIGYKGTLHYLGFFSAPDLAKAAYDEAAARLYGDFSAPGGDPFVAIPPRQIGKNGYSRGRLTASSPVPIYDGINERLSYDPATGIITWLMSGHAGRVGKAAGYLNPDGYIVINTLGHIMRAHRIAWLLTHGEWPADGFEIDHINGIRSDNRIANLRLASRQQNTANSAPHKDNMSGFKGITWLRDKRRWQVRIRSGGKSVSLGYFKTPEEGAAAYAAAANAMNGEFARNEPVGAGKENLRGGPRKVP